MHASANKPSAPWPDATRLHQLQRDKLAAMLGYIRARNPFWQERLGGGSFDPTADPLDRLPLTTRGDLQDDQRRHPPFGTNLSEPLACCTRYHQTSGTNASPLRFCDTPRSWRWWLACWRTIYHAAEIRPPDRIVFPFSFGPFVGFWSAFDAAAQMGCMALPAGGMSTTARLRYIIDNGADVVCCTPTYALRLAEVATAENIDITASPVRALIVAGEPGGNIPATRERIETAWGARVYDHVGMTEVGPWGFECSQSPGTVHVNELQFICELIDPCTGCASHGDTGELVLTNLGRWTCPVIRYRTGDQVRLRRGVCACGRSDVQLVGGVLGRVDDMITIRGNNVFPAAIEHIVLGFANVAEFRIVVASCGSLDQLTLEIEPQPHATTTTADLVAALRRAIRDTLHFGVTVRTVKPGSLPRPQMKSSSLHRKA